MSLFVWNPLPRQPCLPLMVLTVLMISRLARWPPRQGAARGGLAPTEVCSVGGSPLVRDRWGSAKVCVWGGGWGRGTSTHVPLHSPPKGASPHSRARGEGEVFHSVTPLQTPTHTDTNNDRTTRTHTQTHSTPFPCTLPLCPDHWPARPFSQEGQWAAFNGSRGEGEGPVSPNCLFADGIL